MLALITLVLAVLTGGTDTEAPETTPPGSVVSILETHCFRCHGPDKQKGGLRLDRHEDVLDVVTPGSGADSELYFRISLPTDDIDIMPPSAPWLSGEEILTIRRWIDAGAPADAFDTRAAARSARAAAIDLDGRYRVNVVSPGWVAESRQAMGLDPMPGIWAKDLAAHYLRLVEGDATGQVVEAEE